jgi:N-acetylglucosamine-6-sulfatase
VLVSSVSAEAQSDDSIASLYPISPTYNGGFASYGGTKMEVKKDVGVVSLASTQGIGFVRWFVGHKPVSKEAAADWTGHDIRLEVKSLLAPVTTDISAAWRGRVDPAEIGPASKARVEIGEDWTTVTVPVPAFDSIEGNSLTGILFKFAKGGEFELRSIEIVGGSGAAPAQAQATPAATSALVAAPAKPAPQQADVAAPKVAASGQPDPGFVAAHDRNVARAKKGEVDCLFIGDSITANWGKYKPLWEKYFASYKPANFGIGGDCTQHVLWRLQNGELDGISPKVVVIMIGTNNANYHDADSTARGVKEIVDTVSERLPNSKILLVSVFPRGEKPNPYRAKNEKVNATIQSYADNQKVFYLDLWNNFLQPDGSITKEIMPDTLHLSEAGYVIWGDAMAPKLAELMN